LNSSSSINKEKTTPDPQSEHIGVLYEMLFSVLISQSTTQVFISRAEQRSARAQRFVPGSFFRQNFISRAMGAYSGEKICILRLAVQPGQKQGPFMKERERKKLRSAHNNHTRRSSFRDKIGPGRLWWFRAGFTVLSSAIWWLMD